MWTKLLSSVGAKIISGLSGVVASLALSFVQWAIKVGRRMIARKKRVKETQEAARGVEDANTNSDIRDSIDDLP